MIKSRWAKRTLRSVLGEVEHVIGVGVNDGAGNARSLDTTGHHVEMIADYCSGEAMPGELRLARQEGGALVYVGRVGTGWDRETAREIRRALEPLARPTAPFIKSLKKATWVEPRF